MNAIDLINKTLPIAHSLGLYFRIGEASLTYSAAKVAELQETVLTAAPLVGMDDDYAQWLCRACEETFAAAIQGREAPSKLYA